MSTILLLLPFIHTYKYPDGQTYSQIDASLISSQWLEIIAKRHIWVGADRQTDGRTDRQTGAVQLSLLCNRLVQALTAKLLFTILPVVEWC